MEYIRVECLNARANRIINQAVEVIMDIDHPELDSLITMYAMLKNDSRIRERLEATTGIDYSKYIEHIDKYYGETDGERVKKERYNGKISKELRNIFESLTIKNNKENGTKANTIDLYNEIMANEHSYAWGILEEIGVDKRKYFNSFVSPLNSMIVTRKYAIDYNMAISNNKRGIVGRDKEIARIFEILGRKERNNPCLIGESGVGKTAIIEAIAERIAENKAPESLNGKRIIGIDINKVVAGTKFRGEFEERMDNIISEVSKRDDIILFFDEIHMLADAGASNESSINALNILKQPLSRGEIQIIGATTIKEYKSKIERDNAFKRRMQGVIINEPSISDTIYMINNIIGEYEEFHNCKYDKEAIESAIKLSSRYMPDKKLPDKAIGILDETASRIKQIGRKNKIGKDDIVETIVGITGIENIQYNEKETDRLSMLEDKIRERIIGQDKAVNQVCKVIKRGMIGLNDPNKPLGSFLFVGPTGVGKTELAKQLARELFGSNKEIIRFDMSEFMEKHSVSRLIGAPPGYIGHGEGGQLTEAVKRKPYCIVLLDEIEKAHTDIHNILLQVLDEGRLTDSDGEVVNFKNTIIIMTSNIGFSGHKYTGKIGFESESKSKLDNTNDTREEILSEFKAEIVNRIDDIVEFQSLTANVSRRIVEIEMDIVNNRLKNIGICMTWNKSVIDHLVDVGFSSKFGARNIKRKIQTVIIDEITDRVINGGIESGDSLDISYIDNNLTIDVIKKELRIKEVVNA